MSKLLKTLKGEKFKKPPIWLMRQAGRYLPEYLEIRNKVDSFLKLCYNPKLASEITLQPIRRFGFDGAIIFSDILVIPDALGVDVNFIKGDGPKLREVSNQKDILGLKTDNIEKHLEPVFENITITKSKLNKETNLIGFSGSPWTIATYMIEGGSSKNFEKSRSLAIKDPIFFDKLFDILIESISRYLIKQIEAGVEIIKFFDSWAGILPEKQFKKLVLEPHKKIIENVRAKYPEIPIIVFTRGAGMFYEDLAREVDCDSIAIDQNISRNWARDVLQKKHKKIIQGNLDNLALANASLKEIELEVYEILEKFGQYPFVFNLGHGVIPSTPIENIQKVIDLIRKS